MAECYTDDILWCSNRRCNTKKCKRNPKRIRFTPFKEYSFAELDGTDYCVKSKRTPKERGGEK